MDDYTRGRRDGLLEAAVFLNTRQTESLKRIDTERARILLEAMADEFKARAEALTPKLPKGARTLPDGSIRLGAVRRYDRAKAAAERAYDTVGEARRQATMRDAVKRRKGH